MSSHCKKILKGVAAVLLIACFSSPVFAEDPAVLESLTVGKTTVLANNSDLQTATLQFSTSEPETIERVSILINYQDDSGNPNRGYLSWYKDTGFIKEGGYGSEFIDLQAGDSEVVTGTDTITVTFAWRSLPDYGGITDNDIAYYYIQYGDANGWLNHDTNFDVQDMRASLGSLTVDKQTMLANSADVQKATLVFNVPEPDSMERVSILINYQDDSGNPNRGYLSWYKDTGFIKEGGYGSQYIDLQAGDSEVVTGTDTITVTFAWRSLPDYGGITDNDIAYYYIQYGDANGWLNHDTNFDVQDMRASLGSLTVDKQTVLADSADVQKATLVFNVPEPDSMERVSILINYQDDSGNPNRGYLSWYKDTGFIKEGGYGSQYIDLQTAESEIVTGTDTITVTFAWRSLPDYGGITDNDIAYYYIQYGDANGWLNHDTNFDVQDMRASLGSLTVDKQTVLADSADVQKATLVFNVPEPDSMERVSILINYQDDSGNPNRGYLSWYKDTGFIKEGGYGSQYIDLQTAESEIVTGTDTITVTFAWRSLPDYGGITDNDIAYYYIQYGDANGWLNHDTNFDVQDMRAGLSSLTVDKQTVLANSADVQKATLVFNVPEPDSMERVSILINYQDDSGNPNRGYLSWYKDTGFIKEGGYGSEFINLQAGDSEVVIGTDTITVTFAWTSIPDYGDIADNDIAYYYIQYGDANGWLNHDTNFDVVTEYTTLPPTVSIEAEPTAIQAGEFTTLYWISTDADTCTIEPEIGAVDPNGAVAVYPVTDTTYTITATGPEGTARDTVTVLVDDGRPAIEISANPAVIQAGESTTLSWTSTDAYDVYMDQDMGAVGVSGTLEVTPQHTTTYTVTATGPNGSASAQVLVSVQSEPASQPDGAYGQQYEQLVPDDATIAEYDPDTFAVIRGQVLDIYDDPVPDVLVTIDGHPEYGTVQTDTSGEYSLPVEGDATLNVIFQKQGLITAYRKVEVPINDVVIVETPVLLAEDQKATTLTLDGNAQTVLLHESSPVTDTFGTRKATVVMTGDNQAFAVDENGDDLFALSTMTIRATEFKTPESMPAILPPTTSYTYCVELSVDGVANVRFENPVITWIDNFLGFDVGEIVPVGYYDPDQAEWIASENGRVVTLLDDNSDGIVDSLDMDGDFLPDDLDSDGDYADEVAGLDDPSEYTPGDTYWRVEVPHFSAWDCNYPSGPPEGSTDPNSGKSSNVEQQTDQCKAHAVRSDVSEDSYVSCRSRVYHEDIPVAGTGLTLHYATSRTGGYHTVITVPASGSTVPASLKEIIVQVEVGGRLFEQTLPALPDQQAVFSWDGLDYLGQRVLAPTASIRVGFVYDAIYYGFGSTPTMPSFGTPGTTVTEVPARNEIISWTEEMQTLYNIAALPSKLAEGWTLSNHHHLFITPKDTRILNKGNGRQLESGSTIITTVAGTGDPGNGNGADPLAVNRDMSHISGLATDSSGNFYIALYYSNRIFRVEPDGYIYHVAGNGSADYTGDGGPATSAGLNNPRRLTVDNTGNIYFADNGNNCIRKIDTGGIITTVAGNGSVGFSGDNGPATSAKLNAPSGIAVDSAGNLYIADSGNLRIRKVDTSGIITTVAGGGLPYYDDGDPAASVILTNAKNVIVDSSDNFYIADYSRVRKVDAASGIITTVAGKIWQGGDIIEPSGDGGPATSAGLPNPNGLAMDTNGNLYIGELYFSVVRKVDTNGIITTITGTGLSGFSGDGGPANEAQISYAQDVAVDDGGSVYIADWYNKRVRKVEASQSTAFALSSDPTDNQFIEEGVGYIFYADGRHKETVDLNTGMVLETFNYDASDRLVSVTDRFGNQVTVERTAGGVPTAIISPDGIRTELAVNPSSYLLSQISYPDATAYHFLYNNGLMTQETEPNGNFFIHTFNADGRINTTEDQAGKQNPFTRQVLVSGDVESGVTTVEGYATTYLDQEVAGGAQTTVTTSSSTNSTVYFRSSDGFTTQVTQPNETEREYIIDYDPKYRFKYTRQATTVTPAGLTAQMVYNRLYEDTNSDGDTDRITRTASLNGKTTAVVQDLLTSQSTATSPEGRVVTTTYDPATLLTSSVSVPGLLDTSYTYDTRGRVETVQTGTRQTRFEYDADGNVYSILDPENHLTTFEYDALGRTTAVHRPDGTDLYYDYDNNGNMTVLTNPSGIDHGFQYNNVNLAEEYDPPLSGSTTYTYDRDRRLTQTTYPSGAQIVNVYTGGQLTEIQTPEGHVSLSYLASGQVQSTSKGGEQIFYGYDGDLLTSQTLLGTVSQTLSYTYNDDFNLTAFTYAGGTSNYIYDDDGLLTQASGFIITNNASNGLPEGVGNGTFDTVRTFNGYGEVASQASSVSGTAVSSWTLTHDNNGQIATKSESVAGVNVNYVYTYDEVGRLTHVEKDGVLVEEYRYNDTDPLGVRTYEMNSLRGIAGRSLSYNTEDQLLSVGTATYQYDQDGFLWNKVDGADTTSYDYSSRGELLQVDLPSGDIITYQHDPLGRRIAKVVNGSITEKYLWLGLTRLLAIYDGSDNLLMRFEYADSRMPLSMNKSGTTYYLTYDQVGSLRAVADSTGTIIKQIDYDSFGNIIADSDPSFEVPFGFAGGLHDRDTGLVRFGMRDYSPETGRWTAKDPIGFADGDADLYVYALDDPVNLIDSFGLVPRGPMKSNPVWRIARNKISDQIKSKLPKISEKTRNAMAEAIADKLTLKDIKNIQKREERTKEIYDKGELTSQDLKELNEMLDKSKEEGDLLLEELKEINPNLPWDDLGEIGNEEYNRAKEELNKICPK